MLKMSKKLNLSKNTKAIIALVLVAIISIGLSFVTSKPEMYKPVFEVLDEKRADALALSAGALALSAGVAAVPGDATTPIANQISNLTSYILLITCIIFLEKLLLTSMGFVSFAIIIPLACFIWILYILNKKENFKTLAIKLIAFALVIFILVPTSVLLTTLIENSAFYTEAEAKIATAIETEEEEEVGFFERLKDKTVEAVENAKKKANQFIDAIAIMIITTCAIPLGTLALLFWIVKMLFGINIKAPKPPRINLAPKKADKDDIANQLPPANE